jgi:trans-aconitate methyltransferase
MEGGLSSEAFYGQHQHTKALCSRYHACRSVYEVGCGSGANLFLYEQEGMRCGGLDYSPALVRMARSVLRSTDLTCGEAVDLAVEPSYDICLSNSVFHYFASEEYALSVLEKMAQKASKVLALIDIHDKAKEQAFLDFRRRTIPDFETRYQGLPIRSYDRKFFETFAETHHMEILFDHYDMAGYWNNEFVFHCYLYKR